MTDARDTARPAGSAAHASGDGATDPTVVTGVNALPGGLRAALEAVLMVVDEPVTLDALAAATGTPVAAVATTVQALAEEYRQQQRGFELREVAGGWRMYSAAAFGDIVAQHVLEGQTARLTQAALETLAVVAYRQPVTRGLVSAVRGVNVDGVLRTLVARGLVIEVGTDPTSGAHLYGTTPAFLERMGFASLDQLPPLAPYLPEIDGLDDRLRPARATATQGAAQAPTSNEEQQ